MSSTRAQIAIARPAEDVWGVLAEPSAITEWMPDVESCEVAGDTRVVVLAGRRLIEKFAVDHTIRRFTYNIIDRGAPPPLEAHEGSLEVHATDDGALVVSAHHVRPGELAERFQSASARALQALKTYCEANDERS